MEKSVNLYLSKPFKSINKVLISIWILTGLFLTASTGLAQDGSDVTFEADPVIIEDNCFIGARSEVAEGVIIEEGSVLSMGVYIGASTKVVDRSTGEIYMGKVPSYSVVVPGSMAGSKNNETSNSPNLYCAVIVKRVDAKTRSKTSVNDLLRD